MRRCPTGPDHGAVLEEAAGRRIHRSGSRQTAMLSFAVPAHNEEQLLGATLRAIREAAGALDEPFEMVVADDASTDGTAAVARALGAHVVSVRHRRIAAARNAAARAAHGDLLVFVDADTLVTEAAVRAAVLAMRRGAAGGGSAIRFDGRVPLYGRILVAGGRAALPPVPARQRLLSLLHPRGVRRRRRVRRDAAGCGGRRHEPPAPPPRAFRRSPRVRDDVGTEAPRLLGP